MIALPGKTKAILSACIIFLLTTSSIPFSLSLSLPKTGVSSVPRTAIIVDPPGQSLSDFVLTVKNGAPNVVVGVYVPGIFALPVLQQPGNNPGFVFTLPDTVTQFAAASRFGTKGFLAHNFLSGARFFQIEMHKIIYLVYGDGAIKPYIVSAIERYHALQPESLSSDFVDLQNGETILSANEMFKQFYTKGDQVVLQTCIMKDGERSWGRLFIIANPYKSH